MATSRRRTSLDLVAAGCTAAELVGHFVYQDPIGEVRQVDVDDAAKMPAFGVIVRKETTTACVVQTRGVVAGVFVGMTLGPVLIGAAGAPAAAFVRPSAGVRWIQHVGLAITPDQLVLNIQNPIGVQPA